MTESNSNELKTTISGEETCLKSSIFTATKAATWSTITNLSCFLAPFGVPRKIQGSILRHCGN